MRDAAYAIEALIRVGAEEEASAAFAWLLTVVRKHGRELRIFYTLDGDLPAAGMDKPALGSRGSRPVHVGSDARVQRQLGMYGDLFETAALFVERGRVLDSASLGLLVDSPIAAPTRGASPPPASGGWTASSII